MKILVLFFSLPGKIFHVRAIGREIKEEINSVRRELNHLEKIGLLKKEARGNRLYYFLLSSHPFYPELLVLVAKSSALGFDLLKNRPKLGRVKFAMLNGAFIRGKPRNQNQVDLLVVGNIVLPQLAQIIRAEEGKRNQEINYTVMSEEEFSFRKRRKDPFIMDILWGPRIMIIGNEEDLIK